ncbi:endonuclease [Bacteroidales bacterium OttesenSCG-928-A17]|nr:endonuclease [Bacteroidales bacterium OttesenSCG-928-A17]
MKPNHCILFFLLLFFFPALVWAEGNFRVAFYNVENLFDTEDNPRKNDNEFLPEGTRGWTYGKYRNKIVNLAKVISSMGEWGYPAIVGLCEVENEKVLKDLTQASPLRKADYRYIVTDSPDQRGINTALLYQRDKFKLLNDTAYRIDFPYNVRKKTRDILHVTGLIASGDTLDLFICHFPSRRGGEEQSEPDRMYVASVLKSQTDSLFRVREKAHIIIMGDFNDEPSNKSMMETLNAKTSQENISRTDLYNLSVRFEKQKNQGSYKFGRQWNVLDHIIVSGNLLETNKNNFHILPHTLTIFRRDFMMTEDTTHGGMRLKKTFHGYKHEGGYSDHLPVFADYFVPGL